jgi:4-amino-4-deoxy-L-arabinose transferase-like glycosyltransferase
VVPLAVVVLTAAAARLLVLPFATTDGGDAPSRVWSAWSWLGDPHLITHGVWGPLHTYLIAASLALRPDPVYAPVALGILFSVASAALMYAFVQVEFASRRAAVLVALTYALYPIAIRNGVSVRSETPFAFFLLLAMVGVACARRPDGSWRHAAAGGLALTGASMLRYEGWMLIPLIAVLLRHRPRLLLTFCGCAAIHPIGWMIGNAAHYGDPLYSISYASRWELETMGRQAIARAALFRKAAAYPLVILSGMTPPLAAIAVAGAISAAATRHRVRGWLVPFCGLVGLWMLAVGRGSLVPKLNYTETAGTLLFPFSAVVYEYLGVRRWPAAAVAGLAAGLAGLTALASCRACLDRVGLGVLAGIPPVPSIENQAIALQLPPLLSQAIDQGSPALVSDHYGWGAPRYVALQTRLPRERMFLAPGAPNQQINGDSLAQFLTTNPRGVLIILSGSRFSAVLGVAPAAASARFREVRLGLEPLRTLPWPGRKPAELLVFRYQLLR